MRKLVSGLCCLTVVVVCASQSADARPKYLAEFRKKYPGLVGLDEAKCNACHVGSSKKDLNTYGVSLGGELGAKNVKESEEIIKAFVKAEAKSNPDGGKTYGEQLKAKELPK